MSTPFIFRKTFQVIVFLLCFTIVNAQDKNEAKVDSYIAKAQAETDVAKKNELYNKAAEVIMTAKMDKAQYVKIADSYLEEGDVTNAVKFFMRTDKADKNEGYVKIGHKMLETAFDDQKTEAKNVKKALDYFTKGGQTNEGYEAAGDAYYERGKEYRMKAAEYYGLGKVNSKIEKVASEFLADNQNAKAAEVYLKLNSEEGYRKAGDLYFNAGDYNNAFTAYDKGVIADGIKKYADKLYADGDVANADPQYMKVAEMYAEKKNTEALYAMAKTAEERGNYTMAADFYTKGGEPNKAARAVAYGKLTTFDTEGAKTDFQTLGDAEMVKAITASAKLLTPLKDAATYFDDIKRSEPRIYYTEDSVTKKKTYNESDIEIFNTYYKDNLSSIVDYCYTVSANVPKITYAPLKDALMRKFKQYGAIRNVLDANFGKKLQKTQVTEKDVAL
ncbi:MAG: hypothetical protein SH857_02645 [Chitinophagales bacterium]|nr:hypothetical protein [Chitinophagales bacterium]